MLGSALALLALGAPGVGGLELSLSLARPLEQAGSTATSNVLRVGVRAPEQTRAPVNLALVLDRSGSMAGEKLARVRQAARILVDRLGPEDILSVVSYADGAEVLVPATRTDRKEEVIAALSRLEARGDTALFAGVSLGLAELRRFLDPARVDRMILVSDGDANLGPSTPSELDRLGASAAKQGIAISTIGLGLGYNEDLMSRLASASGGNHGFAETAEALGRLFDAELRDLLSVAAREVEIAVHLPEGMRPVRSLNRAAEVYPSAVIAELVQLPAERDRTLLVELELDPRAVGARAAATVEVRAIRPGDGVEIQARDRAEVRWVADPAQVARAENPAVMVDTIEAIGVQTSRRAVELKDRGLEEQAQKALLDNADLLQSSALRYGSSKLEVQSAQNRDDAKGLEDAKDWQETRKKMRSRQHKLDTQQSY